MLVLMEGLDNLKAVLLMVLVIHLLVDQDQLSLIGDRIVIWVRNLVLGLMKQSQTKL